MSGALLDKLRLEVLASSVAANLVTNHSAQAGVTTGWTKGSTYPDATFTADSGLAWGYGGKAFKLVLGGTYALISPTPPTRHYGYVWMKSDHIPVVGLQWINVVGTFRAPSGKRRSVELQVRFYNNLNVQLGEATYVYNSPGTGTAWAVDADNVISIDSSFPLYDGPAGPPQAPSGTSYMVVTIQVEQAWEDRFGPTWESPKPTWVSEIMIIKGASQSLVSGVVFSDEAESWQNVLPKALTARVLRGGDVDGVTDKLDAGLLVATVKDPQLTPENNDRIRPGRPIRLMGLNGSTWEPVFRGKLSFARTSYAGDVPVVSLTATDAMADLENYPVPIGKSGRFKQRVDTAMVNVPLDYTVTDTDSNTTQATISADANATALAQLTLIRDSLRGLFYVAKDNVLRCFANNSYPSQTATVEFSDDEQNEPGTIGYTTIDTNFDSKNMVNTLTITKTALSEPDGSKVYGPFVNQDSADEWLSVSADLKVNDGDPADLAGAYLAVYDEPTIFADSLTYEATDDVASAIERELYEAAAVKFEKADLDTVYRIISIEHVITANKWLVTVKFKPLESTSAIVVTNPPGGPDSGPADLVPFTREIQHDVENVSWVASSTGQLDVVFDKPYESPPHVIAGYTGASTSPRIIWQTDLVTKDGFRLRGLIDDGVSTTTTRPAIWVAFPN